VSRKIVEEQRSRLFYYADQLPDLHSHEAEPTDWWCRNSVAPTWGFSAHLGTFPIHPVACFSVGTFIPIGFPCIPLALCPDRVSLHLAGTLVLFGNLPRALPSFYKVYLPACRLRTLLLLSLILLQAWLALSLSQMSLALLDKWSYNRPLVFAGLAAATSTPFKKRVRA